MTDTRYDAVPGHPLAGVPREVLDVAYDALGAWELTDDVGDDELRAVADAVVANLRSRGYVTWPTRLPDRESLVLALVGVANEYVADEEHQVGSYGEFVIDRFVLPLLRRLNGDDGSADTDDQGGGVRRADAGA